MSGKMSSLFWALIGGLIGSIIEGLGGTPKVWISIGFGIAASIIGGCIRISKKLWPSRANWLFTTNGSAFPEKVFQNNRVNWRKDYPSEETFFMLDMLKERVISGVQFEHGNSNNVPDEWQMSFYSRYKGYVMPNINGKPFIKGQGVILVSELEKPVKARYIRVEVKKPTFEADRLLPWDIEDIRIRENRIGKLWRKVIDN